MIQQVGCTCVGQKLFRKYCFKITKYYFSLYITISTSLTLVDGTDRLPETSSKAAYTFRESENLMKLNA
jgi:hypothetical protein